MKFICPSCQQLADISSVRAEGAQVVFTCSQCGADTVQATGPSFAPRTTPAAVAGPPAPVPLPLVPPLAVRQPSLDAMPASALPLPAAAPAPKPLVLPQTPSLDPAYAADPFYVPPDRCPKCLAGRSDSPACRRCGLLATHAQPDLFLPSEAISALWKKLWQRWSDPLEHERFRQAAMSNGELAEAGRLYQLRLTRSPGDAEADHGREELLRMVSTVGMMERTPRSASRRWRKFAWAIVMVAATAVAMGIARALLAR